MGQGELECAIEAILFAMGAAVPVGQIAKALDERPEHVREAVEQLKNTYDREKRGIQIIGLEDSYQMCTRKDYYPSLIQIAAHPVKPVLTEVMLETLSIIAYKQPVTRAEIEKIRGVKCDHAVNKLIEYDLIQELGRLDAPGRPILFGTTEEFLRSFGVQGIDELPSPDPVKVEDFKAEALEEAELRLNV